MNDQATVQLRRLIDALAATIAWARWRHRGDYGTVAARLRRLAQRADGDETAAAYPVRRATELELRALVDAVIHRLGDRERSEILSEVTEHGRLPFPAVLAGLDPSRGGPMPEPADQVRILGARAATEIRDLASRPGVGAARSCVLTLEELAEVVLRTEAWPLTELAAVGARLAEAIQVTVGPEQRLELAHDVDRFLFDALVGRGKPRGLGQFGPNGWRPIYRRIEPSRWELERLDPKAQEARFDLADVARTAEPPACVEGPGDPGQERTPAGGEGPEGARRPLSIRFPDPAKVERPRATPRPRSVSAPPPQDPAAAALDALVLRERESRRRIDLARRNRPLPDPWQSAAARDRRHAREELERSAKQRGVTLEELQAAFGRAREERIASASSQNSMGGGTGAG